jgi:CheY-like chemotaxis protein
LTEGARRALKGLLHELPAPWCEHPALADAARLVDGGVTLAAQLSVLAANQPQHLEVVDLRTALPGWLAPLQAAAPAGVRWQVQLPDAALRVLADVGPLRLAVQALCANACQALAERGGQIEVGLTRTEDHGVSLTVRDEGVGMSADVQARAFEPFFSTQPPARAAGLGLAVVHAVADALQGRVALTSQVGEGTTVTLWLPRVDEAAAVSAGASVAAGSPGVRARTASPGPRGPRHVVYVDDYEAMGYLMSRMLGRLGHRVTAFERASDALAYLEAHAHEVDLLVSDYNMPVFSGMDVVRRARALRPDLPVLLTSGHSTPSMVREAEAEGVLQVFNRHDSVQAQVEAIDAVLATLPPRGEAGA